MKTIKVWVDVQSSPPNFKTIESILAEKTTNLFFSLEEIPKEAYKEIEENTFSSSYLESYLKKTSESDLLIAFTYVNLEKNISHSSNCIVKKIISNKVSERLAAQLIYVAYCILEQPLKHFDERTKNNILLSIPSLSKFTDYSEHLSKDETNILGKITFESEPSQIYVAMTHGIRTHAEWAEPAKSILKKHGINSDATKYDWVDTIKFAFVLWVRKKYARDFLKDIIDAKDNNPKSRLCISVHSYGSIVLIEALQLAEKLNITLKIDSIILSGSILPTSFDWGKYTNKNYKKSVSIKRILNIKGSQDIWPVFAKYFVRGAVGYSGTFGLSAASNVTDIRINAEDHGGILEEKYIESIWVEYLQNGYIDKSKYDGTPSIFVSGIDYILKVITFLRYPAVIYGFLFLAFPQNAEFINNQLIALYSSLKGIAGNSCDTLMSFFHW